ncbi:MAG: LytTR family DNA-binding domain-containing protein [Firmicutes bacterium]|nr:LytTR family DNA-binding domain-containing protein [Bacillota bacterium]
MIRTVIVDDEIPVRDELEYLLTREKALFEIVGCGQTGEEAVELCNTLRPDVVFLDIHMYGMNGMEAAKNILKNNSSPPVIIFATAYQEYAVKAFEINAVDYILKPLSDERIDITINKIRHLLKYREQPRDHIMQAIHSIERAIGVNAKIGIWSDGRFLFIDQKDIVYLEAQRKHTLIYTEYVQYKSTTAFGELQQKLDDQMFFKIHRSYVINLNHIKEVGVWFSNHLCVVMSGYEKIKIPVSKNQAKIFKQRIGM